MGLIQTVAPKAEPITVFEATEHLRISDDDWQSGLLTVYIQAAREHIETETHRQLCAATWELTLDAFPASGGEILLPRPPLSSVTSIEYVDVDGTDQAWDVDEYDEDTTSLIGRITEAYGCSWPTARSQANAVTVTFVAGYGTPEKVPAALKAAVLMATGDLNEHREMGLEVIVRPNPTVARLIRNYKVPEVH